MAPRSLFPPRFPIRPSHFLHQTLPYGSTHSGFSAWSSVSHAHFWQHFCRNGRVDTRRSPRHVTVHTNEHGFERSSRRASTNFAFPGQSKRCLRCYTSLFSCSSQASLCSFSISLIQFSTRPYHGSVFVQPCTRASHSCRYFGTTVHTTPRFLHRHGIFTVDYYSHCSEFSGGS